MIQVRRDDEGGGGGGGGGDDDGGDKGPVMQHGCFIGLGLAIIAGFAWLCTTEYEFRRYSMRFIFSHPFIVGGLLLVTSVVHIVIFFRRKLWNKYGRDYTQNYLGWLWLIMGLGFIIYGLTRPGS